MSRHLLCAALSLFAATATMAANVSGTISNQVWTAQNSPYRVTDAITIPAGDSLVIEPGVDVLFDAQVQFTVNGKLRATGNSVDSVRFLPGTAVGWAGIDVLAGGDASMQFVRVSGGIEGPSGSSTGSYSGGGIYVDGTGSILHLRHSVVSGNAADNDGGGIAGWNSAEIHLENTVIMNNGGGSWAAGLSIYYGSTATVDNCAIHGNAGGSVGGIFVYVTGSTLTVRNSIVWGNSHSGIHNYPSNPGSITVEYSTVQGGWTGTGNISDDPLFTDPANGDFTLQPASPARNAGDPNAPLEPDGTRLDMGLYWYDPIGTPYIGMPQITELIDNDVTIDVIGRFTDSLSVSFAFIYDPAIIAPAEDALISTAYDGLAGAEVLYDVVEGETIDTLFADLSASEGPPHGVDLLARFAFTALATGESPLVLIPAESMIGGNQPLLSDGSVTIVPVPWGDVTRNNRVTSLDAATVLHNVAFGLPLPPEADVSGTEGATAYDAALILTKVVTPDYLFPVEQAARIAVSPEPIELAWNRTADGWRLDADVADGPVGALVVLRLPETATVTSTGPLVENRQGTDVRIATARLEGGGALFTVTGVENTPGIVSARVNERETSIDGTPAEFSLAQNTPNPFNPRTTLRFSIAEAGAVRLAIYDVNGRLVRTLVNGALTAGTHEVVWDGRDAVGREVASGVYVYRLTAGERAQVRKAVLAR